MLKIKLTAAACSLLISLASGASSSSITCPKINCGMDIGKNVCYLHSASNPVSYIRMQECPSDKYCDIGDASKYAWIDAEYQQYASGRQAALSQVFGQKTVGYCRSAKTIDSMLNNGRMCSTDN